MSFNLKACRYTASKSGEINMAFISNVFMPMGYKSLSKILLQTSVLSCHQENVEHLTSQFCQFQ